MQSRIIVVEDDLNWLDDICKSIEKYFDVIIERFTDFSEAEKRIEDNSDNFELLITDVFPPEPSKELAGLKFANFLKKVSSVPVIVITAEEEYAFVAIRDYGVKDAFYKATFTRMKLIDSISSVIPPKKPKKEEDVVEKKIAAQDSSPIKPNYIA